ncbi:MAG TPA: type II secretion system protein [Stenomitos sp.]
MASRNAREAGFSLLELSLTIAIGLGILASSVWMMKQHNAEARVQQSKMLLATLRTNFSAYRYRTGNYPSLTAFSNNDAGGGQKFIPNVASISEPVSSVAAVRSFGATTSYDGGWVYDAPNGTIRVNLDPAKFPGDNPALW